MKTIVWIMSSSEWALSKSLHKHFIALIYVIVLSLPSPAASDVDTRLPTAGMRGCTHRVARIWAAPVSK